MNNPIYLIVEGDRHDSPIYYVVFDKKGAITEALRRVIHCIRGDGDYVDLLEINSDSTEVREIDFEYDTEGAFTEEELTALWEKLEAEDDEELEEEDD